jgi:hypothetical protein
VLDYALSKNYKKLVLRIVLRDLEEKAPLLSNEALQTYLDATADVKEPTAAGN